MIQSETVEDDRADQGAGRDVPVRGIGSDHGRWEEARRDFNAKMSEALDGRRLAGAWARMASLVGGYEGMGEPFAHRVGDHTVVEIPLRFKAGEATGRVVFDEDGKVAGLWLGNAERARVRGRARRPRTPGRRLTCEPRGRCAGYRPGR